MGNTASSQSPEGGSTPHLSQSAPATTGTPGGPSGGTPNGPVILPRPIGAGGGTASGSGTPRHAPSAFHSGLTPPQSPPSPPPPSTPPLLPHAGHLSSQNPHALGLPQMQDYSKTVVTRLIIEGKLAPFYRGLEDVEEDWDEDKIGEVLAEVKEKDYEDGVANSVVARMKEEREPPAAHGVGSVVKKIHMHKRVDSRALEDKEERERREKKAYSKTEECPICFLNYPNNINTTRCCQQPICTECFVQIHRADATLTHLESEPASCPFCVETDFGVIYERPIEVSESATASQTALSMSPSPDPGASGFSHALTTGSEDAELDVGLGMAPKVQEKMRRKSVNAKAKEVVLTDEVRPDWEKKLNEVKAAAARKASRRIVMRQVGDRLIPIGFTSARAPGVADFSMSVPTGTDENGSRRSRRGTRERDLEELMIMEAMRLSMVDHEEHQKKMHEDAKRGGTSTPPRQLGESSTSAFSSASWANRKRSNTSESTGKQSQASKLLSKLGGRSRSGSSASKLSQIGEAQRSQTSFVMPGSASNLGSPRIPGTPSARSSISNPASPPPLISTASGSTNNTSASPTSPLTSTAGVSPTATTTSSPLAAMSNNTLPPPESPIDVSAPHVGGALAAPAPISTAVPSAPSQATPTASSGSLLGRSPPSGLARGGGNPVAPITTLANHTAVKEGQSPSLNATTAALPKVTVDMPALTPDATVEPAIRKSEDQTRIAAASGGA